MNINTLTTAIKLSHNNQEEPTLQKLWQPSESRMINSSRFVKTYEEWLNEKKQAKKKAQENVQSIDVENTADPDDGHQDCPEDDERRKAYREWHTNKEKELRKQKLLKSSDSLSPQPIRRTRTMSSNPGFTFEEWLEKKRSEQPQRSLTPNLPAPQRTAAAVMLNTKREQLRHGMTFEDWKVWKSQERQRKLKEIAENYENSFMDSVAKERRQALNARNFEQWLRQKNEERRLAMTLEKTAKAQRDEEKQRERVERYYDSHLKTYDEWLMEKKYSERFNNSNDDDGIMSDGFEDDDAGYEVGKIIYNMWLKNKFTQEMQSEKERLDALKSNVGNKREQFSSSSEDEQDSSADEDEDESKDESRKNSVADKINNDSSTDDNSEDEDESKAESRKNSVADKSENDSSTDVNSEDEDEPKVESRKNSIADKRENDSSTDVQSEDEKESEVESRNNSVADNIENDSSTDIKSEDEDDSKAVSRKDFVADEIENDSSTDVNSEDEDESKDESRKSSVADKTENNLTTYVLSLIHI